MSLLIQQLVKKGILEKTKAASLEYEIKSSGKKEEEVLIERGITDEDLLFSLKSANLKIPLKEVAPNEIPLKVLELIPEESAKYYKMVPLAKKDNHLEIGMVYPEDLKAQEALKFLSRQSKFSYRVFLITQTNFSNLLKQYRTLRREVTRALEELEAEIKTEKIIARPLRAIEFEKLAEEAPIIKVVAVILKHAVEGKSSDIHIEPTQEKLRVRFRLDGVLHSSIFLPLKIHPAVVARIKILSNLKIDETRMPQDGRFSTKIDNKNIDFRVSTFPTTLGEKAALRVLDPGKGLKDFKELGLEGRNSEAVKRVIDRPHGLILATGPTGCGKSTTLYTILNFLNKEEVNIVTLEDPVEYFIEGINQSQIKPDIGYDFATGLRHILRQDPDIIMVGEIRDKETAALAIHAALTGHIVLSTLHTNNALGVVPRLIDMGIEPYLITPALNMAMGQRLVRKLCEFCKKKVKPEKEIKDLILKEISSLPLSYKKNLRASSPLSIYRAGGCKKCNQKGLTGRIAIFEVLEMTDDLSQVILEEPSESMIKKAADRQGMISMRQDGILKALEGITSIEEVLRVTEEK
ncbi:GspE/PulE family protein [Patescibacteria group bacterium]|nr:GspE/PulE family protein [Patescibacteria group bacterium]